MKTIHNKENQYTCKYNSIHLWFGVISGPISQNLIKHWEVKESVKIYNCVIRE